MYLLRRLFRMLLCMVAATAALAYPRPPAGTEDIPGMMQSATLVCKGEVTDAPKPVTTPNTPRYTVFATVRMERCFKGTPVEREIRVQMEGAVSPVDPAFVLYTGDYRLFFLKFSPPDSSYVVVDQWFGALKVSRELSWLLAGNDPMERLEMDLKAGFADSHPERVLDSIRMLGNMRKLHSTGELKALLLVSRDLLVKTYVWQALLRLADYSVLPAVAKFFDTQPEAPMELFMPRDRMFSMQHELVNEIGRIKSAEARPYLEKFALSDKRRLRNEALQALRQIRSPRSAPAFLRALDDPDNGFVAMMALFELAGSCDCDWVPSWEGFRQSPAFYADKTREWWAAEGQHNMKLQARK
jgi:HEAT repeats